MKELELDRKERRGGRQGVSRMRRERKRSGDGRTERNARKPKTPEGDTAGASQRKADAMVAGTGKREEDVCFQEIQSLELWRARGWKRRREKWKEG